MDKAKKKHTKKILSWVCIAALVLTLTMMPLMAKKEAQKEGPVASVLSGTVEKGSVSTVLRGGGSLQLNTAEEVKLPSGVKITEFLVKNGDVVTAGTPLAAVDSVSVMTAVMEVKETLEYLQEKIEENRKETVSSTVSATAGGRVKEVYAQVGDSVQEVMLRHGALAVLSLDSLMAVKLEQKMEIATGDSVVVTLSDGSEVPGRVESNLDGIIVVTVEDEGYPIGERVTVTTENGDKVGAGQLYVHNAWKAAAFTGTIGSVSAREEREVTAGATLFTLKDTDFAAQLEYLSDQHREYEKLLQDLFRMQQTGAITAPCDGVVSGVDEDSAFLLSGGEGDWEAVPLNAPEEKGWTVVLLSAEEPAQPDSGSGEETPETAPSEEAAALYTGFAGLVTQVGSDAVIVTMSQVGGPVTKTDEGGWDLSQVSLDKQNMIHTNMTFAVADASAYSVGDVVVVVYDESGNYTVEVAVKAAPEPSVPEETLPGEDTDPTLPGQGQYPGGMPDLGGMDISGLLGGFGRMPGVTGGSAEEEEQELFDLEGDVLMTVTPQDTVSVTITLDEQDISRVSVGQTAQVKVEALENQVFEGEIRTVSNSGTNNGGSSKFAVKLELPYADDMLEGMSAVVEIPLHTRLDVLTIPVKALAGDGAKTVVYTALDEETGEPSAPVEVTIGLSDGITAEIVSGLEMGDGYYYSYYDVLELDTKAEAEMSFGF